MHLEMKKSLTNAVDTAVAEAHAKPALEWLGKTCRYLQNMRVYIPEQSVPWWLPSGKEKAAAY